MQHYLVTQYGNFYIVIGLRPSSNKYIKKYRKHYYEPYVRTNFLGDNNANSTTLLTIYIITLSWITPFYIGIPSRDAYFTNACTLSVPQRRVPVRYVNRCCIGVPMD